MKVMSSLLTTLSICFAKKLSVSRISWMAYRLPQDPRRHWSNHYLADSAVFLKMQFVALWWRHHPLHANQTRSQHGCSKSACKNFFHPSPWSSTLPCIQAPFRRPTRLRVLHLWSKRLVKTQEISTITDQFWTCNSSRRFLSVQPCLNYRTLGSKMNFMERCNQHTGNVTPLKLHFCVFNMKFSSH